MVIGGRAGEIRGAVNARRDARFMMGSQPISRTTAGESSAAAIGAVVFACAPRAPRAVTHAVGVFGDAMHGASLRRRRRSDAEANGGSRRRVSGAYIGDLLNGRCASPERHGVEDRAWTRSSRRNEHRSRDAARRTHGARRDRPLVGATSASRRSGVSRDGADDSRRVRATAAAPAVRGNVAGRRRRPHGAASSGSCLWRPFEAPAGFHLGGRLRLGDLRDGDAVHRRARAGRPKQMARARTWRRSVWTSPRRTSRRYGCIIKGGTRATFDYNGPSSLRVAATVPVTSPRRAPPSRSAAWRPPVTVRGRSQRRAAAFVTLRRTAALPRAPRRDSPPARAGQDPRHRWWVIGQRIRIAFGDSSRSTAKQVNNADAHRAGLP